jgi:glycosyltransferase involved in cell wall biosynthesis
MIRPTTEIEASVIMPVFDAGAYLASAISSVLEQTFVNFELIMIDDGSRDDSLAIMRTFSAVDARCIVHSRENRGIVRTLNEGIGLSRADILIRMDADDRCHPRRFELQMQYMRDNPDCAAVGSDAMLVDPDGQNIRPYGVQADHDDIDANHMRGIGGMIVHPTAVLRKATLLAAGGYREAFQHAEDFDLFLRLAEVGRLANLPDILLDYRQSMRSASYSLYGAQFAAAERALAEARGRRKIVAPASPEKPDGPATRSSVNEVHRMWAWWALNAGNIATARKHALKAVTHAPFSSENIRLMFCVLRGH